MPELLFIPAKGNEAIGCDTCDRISGDRDPAGRWETAYGLWLPAWNNGRGRRVIICEHCAASIKKRLP